MLSYASRGRRQSLSGGAGLDPQIQGVDRVREVFARVRNGDDRAADLFVEDGVVRVRGREIEGREAIRAFYRAAIDAVHPQPEVREVRQDGLFLAVLDVPSDRGPVSASTCLRSTMRAFGDSSSSISSRQRTPVAGRLENYLRATRRTITNEQQ